MITYNDYSRKTHKTYNYYNESAHDFTTQLETALCNPYCFCNTELRTATVTKIKGLSIQTQLNTFVLFTLLKLTLDERKTLTKISMRNLSQQFPQTSARFGHNEIRKPANSSLQKQMFASPGSPPEALTASLAVAEEAIAAMEVLPRLPPKRMARLPPLIPRAPVPLLFPRHHHAIVDERPPMATSTTRTQRTQARRRRRRTRALPGRTPATRHVRTVAAISQMPTFSPSALSMSLNSCILSIKDFIAQLMCLL